MKLKCGLLKAKTLLVVVLTETDEALGGPWSKEDQLRSPEGHGSLMELTSQETHPPEA